MAIACLLPCSGFRDWFILRVNRQNLHGVAEFPPGIKSALQWPDMLHASLSQEQRHTGAGGFVWSSTVENDFAVARQPFVGLLEFIRVYPKCTGDRFRVGFEVH